MVSEMSDYGIFTGHETMLEKSNCSGAAVGNRDEIDERRPVTLGREMSPSIHHMILRWSITCRKRYRLQCLFSITSITILPVLRQHSNNALDLIQPI